MSVLYKNSCIAQLITNQSYFTCRTTKFIANIYIKFKASIIRISKEISWLYNLCYWW